MAGSKSSRKGGVGERELCKILGDIFEGKFLRSPQSGAFIGGQNARRKTVMSVGQIQSRKGDIVPPDHMLRLVIEMKNFSKFLFHQLISPGSCPQLDEWIKQTLDVVDPGDCWLVCFKVTRVGLFVAIPKSHGMVIAYSNHCVYRGLYGDFIITDLKTFFQDNRAAILAATMTARTP